MTPDNQVRGTGYGEWNGEVTYALDRGWKLGLGLYNLLDTRANAAEFWYTDRLPGEPQGGISDLHVHPLEPLSVRFSFARTF